MFHCTGCCYSARSSPRKFSISTRRLRLLPGRLRRRRDRSTAFCRREVGLLCVVAHHARGREPRGDRGDRGFHHFEPTNRQVVGLALIEERDDFVLQDIVERLAVLMVLGLGVGVFLGLADGPTRIGILHFTPPTV